MEQPGTRRMLSLVMKALSGFKGTRRSQPRPLPRCEGRFCIFARRLIALLVFTMPLTAVADIPVAQWKVVANTGGFWGFGATYEAACIDSFEAMKRVFVANGGGGYSGGTGYELQAINTAPGPCNYRAYNLNGPGSVGYIAWGQQAPQCGPNSTSSSSGFCRCNKGYESNPSQSACVPLDLTDRTGGLGGGGKGGAGPGGGSCGGGGGGAGSGAGGGFGNPIYPLTGAKKEFVHTAISIGGVNLSLIYDTTVRLPINQSVGAGGVDRSRSFGELWRSSYHQKLQVSPSLRRALLLGGDGSAINFSGNGAGTFTAIDHSHKLITIAGGYRFTDASSGALHTFDAGGKLVSIAAATGSVLTFVYSGENLAYVRSGDGRTVRFTYSAAGFVTRIAGPDAAAIVAAYDANNNLVSLTWPDGKTAGFLYENTSLPWALTGKIDENNVRYATFEYDSDGRAVSTEHAGGVEKFTVAHESAPVRTVTDGFDSVANVLNRTLSWSAAVGTSLTKPNGQTVQFGVQLVSGMPVPTSQSQPAGSGCAASVSGTTYDSIGNVLSRDDFRGSRICYAYDASQRETVRVEGLANTASCAIVLAPGAALPAGARKISTSWHLDWGMPTQVSQPLRRTNTIYHGQSDPFNGNTAANCTSAAVRADGKPLAVVCKQVEQATLDTGTVGSPVTDDPHLDKVVLLLHGNGVNNSVSAIDDSPSGRAVSVVGDTKISTAKSKFGGSSIAFDGSGDYLSTPNSSDLAFGSGDFTIEAFVYPTAAGTLGIVGKQRSGVYGEYGFYLVDGAVRFSATTGGEQCCSWNLVNVSGGSVGSGAWKHVAVTRAAGTFRIFVDGIQVASATASGAISDGTAKLSIGSLNEVGGGPFAGYVDELRISKGVARYTANFTPPALEYIGGASVGASVTRYTYDSGGRVLSSIDPKNRTTTYAYFTDTTFTGSYDPYIDQVSLLLHGNGEHNSTSITDVGATQHAVSVVGNAKTRTTQSKFGGASLAFDGAGDYLRAAAHADFDFGTGDFTIEGYIYPVAFGPTDQVIVTRYTAWASSLGFYLGTRAGSPNILIFRAGNGAPISLNGNTALTANQWQHVAVTRAAGVTRLFVGGVLQAAAHTGSVNISNTSVLSIGSGPVTNDENYNGYLDEFRITKGVARYTANFTPPAAEFLNHGPTAASTGRTVGDLASITNAAGHVTQFNLYDPAGRVRQMTDAKGVVTDITYTPRGWVSTVVVTPPGGAARTTTYTYDFVGQLTGVSNPDGTSLAYSYDHAHRLVGVTDARGNVITYTLDSTGNRIAEEVRDPTGTLQRAIGRSFDALNRLQQVTGATE